MLSHNQNPLLQSFLLLLLVWRVCISFWKAIAHLHSAARALSSPSRCFQLSTNLDKDLFGFLLCWDARTIFTSVKLPLISCGFFHTVKLYTAKIKLTRSLITQPTKSKSLLELIEESVIVTFADYFCRIHIFFAKLLMCSQTFISLNWTYSKTRDIIGVICTFFTRKRGSSICHVLLTVQNTHRRALLFVDNRQFIGFLHKQN